MVLLQYDIGVSKRILITNDDGFDSPGLHALVERSSALGLSPVVAACAQDMIVGEMIQCLGDPTLAVVASAFRERILNILL